MHKLKKNFKRVLSMTAAAAVLMASPCFMYRSGENAVSALEPGQVANPVIWADVPDPDIIRVGDTYYMVSTTMYFTPGAPIMKSKDLVSWEICSYVYDTMADGAVQTLTQGKHDYAHGSWAASLRYNKGTFYVFFGSYGTGKSYIYKTTDIESGNWTRSEINGMYHDASMLFDDDGRNYLVYGGDGNIKMKELNSEMTGFASGAQERTIIKTGLSGLAGEGAHIQKINGWYYVFLIAWPNGSGRIELCYRSKSLTGTFEGKTVLNSGLGTYGAGVAQGGIVQTPDGDWYGLLFQDHGSVGRIPVLVPVTWQNDWPMMGVNGKAPVILDMPGGHTGTSLAKDDQFDYSSNKLMLEWQWNHNPDNRYWSVTANPGHLRLTNGATAKSILHARNSLTQRTEGPACSGVIKMDVSHMKPGDCAGLSAFQFNYGNVGVRVTDSGEKKIYMATNGAYGSSTNVLDSYDKIAEEVTLSGNTVYLKTDYRFNTVDSNYNVSNNIDKVNFYYSLDGSSWKKIGKELGMTYDLKLFTGYRNAIYSYGTKSTGGYVDIDYFDYERETWNAPTVVEPDANGYFFHDDFEGNLGKWTARGGCQVLTSGRTAYKGSEALLVMERTASWNGAQRTLSTAEFKPGNEYAFSACFQTLDGPTQVEYKLTLQYDQGGETKYAGIDQKTAVKGEYVQLYNPNYKIPEGASNLVLVAETTEETCNFYVDEIIGAVAGTAIDGPQATSLKRGDIDRDGRITVADMVLLKSGILGGFSDDLTKYTADIDSNTLNTSSDAVALKEYLLGMITEFPVVAPPEPEKKPFNYNSALSYKAAPDSYVNNTCSQAGKIINETYNGINGTNKLNVYLPYGYDENKQYNIFYLMHGGGENENTIFSKDVKLNNILDHMIMNGELEPLIVVTPTFNKCAADKFYDEFRKSVVPFVEGKYSTYAKSTSEADLRASRMHRAYGGFSMGGLSTWCVADHAMDLVGYFMPLSGNNWEGMSKLTAEIDSLGLQKDQYFILAATGDQDIAYSNMVPEMNDLKTKTKYFTYTSDFSKGNLYFLVAPGLTHWWGYVRHYVYDALPYFFHE